MKSTISKVVVLVLLFILSACTATAPELTEVAPAQPSLTQVAPATAQPEISLTPEPTRDPNHPRAIVEDFYNWYFKQPQGIVLNDRTYQNSPYLTDIFKSDVGYMLDAMLAEGPGYDPFTCAQNTLPDLTIAELFISDGSAYALAEVVINNEVRHYFVIQLGAGEGSWKIDAVNCPQDPKTTAMAFATWYLGFAYRDQDAQAPLEPPGNPVMERAYQSSFLLTPAFIQKIDEQVEQGLTHDPILQAQVLPFNFWVQERQGENSATIRFDFGPQSARYYHLYLLSDPLLGWKINEIDQVPVPVFDPEANSGADLTNWQEYNDPVRGFSFLYPADWSWRPIDQSAMPEDDPVEDGVFFFAPGLDPNVPVLWLHVFEGSEGQLLDYYVTEAHQKVQINGQTAWVDREQCNTRYVFKHPSHESTWLLIGDTCPSMEGREGYAAALADVIAPLLRSVNIK